MPLATASDIAGLPNWLRLAIQIGGVFVTGFSAVWATYSARKAKASEAEAARLRNLEERNASRKFETYEPMIQLLRDMFVDSDVMDEETTLEKLHNFAAWNAIYGSDAAVLAFRNLMAAAFTSPPPQIYLRLYAEFILAIRSDLGHPNSAITADDVLGSRITDFYSGDGMGRGQTLDQLAAGLGYPIPWKSQSERILAWQAMRELETESDAAAMGEAGSV
jgi:hypothetical protein